MQGNPRRPNLRLARSVRKFLGLSLPILMVGCGPSAPSPEADPVQQPEFSTAEVDAWVDSLRSEPAPPTDESLLDKILRSHPDLRDLEQLYVDGSEHYVDGQFDLAEEYFYVLQERVAEERSDQPDSLALLYLGSLERKLGNFIEILTEERFFSESYAPLAQSLADAYDSLRTAYGLPDFLLPEPPTPSSFDSELLLVQNEKVDGWIQRFQTRGRSDFQTWLDRRGQVGGIIEGILEEEGLPPELIHLAMIESGLQPNARSRASAVGWWQFLRSTARNRGLQVDEWVDERRDIERSTRAACRHLNFLHGMFQSWPLALAAYNAGEYRIQRAIGLQGDPDYWQLRLPRETREYVPKFIAAARIGRDPDSYGFSRVEQDTLRYDTIELDDTFSLDQIAKAASIPERTLRELNPQLLSGVTPPNRNAYALRVPIDRGETTLLALQGIPEAQRITWRKHRVRTGETLGALARQYGTSVNAIMELNGISNPRRIRAGRELTIPYPRGLPDPSTAARGTVASNSVPQPATAPDGKRNLRYTVRSGDTLSTIAERHGISVNSIRRLNQLRGTRIVAGQILYLQVDADLDIAAAPWIVDESTHERTEYRVAKGDTLFSIGRRFGVDVAALLAWNDLPTNATIRPGDRLSIWRPRSH